MAKRTVSDREVPAADTQMDESIMRRPLPRKSTRLIVFLLVAAIALVMHIYTVPWVMQVMQHVSTVPTELITELIERMSFADSTSEGSQADIEMSRFETGYRLVRDWPAAPEDVVYYTQWEGGVNFILADGRPTLVVHGNQLLVEVYEFDEGCNLTRYDRLTEVPYKGHLVRLRDTVLNTSDQLVLERDGQPDYFVLTNLLRCGITINLNYTRETPASP